MTFSQRLIAPLIVSLSLACGLAPRDAIAADTAANEAQYRARYVGLASKCPLPQASPAHLVVFFGAWGGNAISSTSLGGDDVEVGVGDIEIEPGDAPLYLILSSREAIIWRFTGAVERVTHVALDTFELDDQGNPRAGFVGLPTAALSAVKDRKCLQEMAAGELNGAHAAGFRNALIEALVGRKPEKVLHAAGYGIAMPSGARAARSGEYPDRRTLPTDGPSAEIWRSLLRERPGGVVEIDPASVVTSSRAARYQVLPGEAGLADLVDQGVLEPHLWSDEQPIGDHALLLSRLDRMREAGPHRLPVGFRILKPMRFLGGNLHVDYVAGLKFELAPGVMAPTGVPKGECVRDERTGRPILGECR